MVKGKKALSTKNGPSNFKARDEALRPEEKIARMLGILAVQSVKNQLERVSLLKAGGFKHSEIADMLGISENGVSVFLYQAKRRRDKKTDVSD
jgi:DNA-directed RNA polymerase specialized sigma24 family protein